MDLLRPPVELAHCVPSGSGPGAGRQRILPLRHCERMDDTVAAWFSIPAYNVR
jgi:hypothetical protein